MFFLILAFKGQELFLSFYRNVVKTRTSTGTVDQFEAFVAVLNECGQVMGYTLTKSQRINELGPLLCDISTKQPTICYTDQCCKDRNKLQQYFGPDVRVCLDSFHALKRIRDTVKTGDLTKKQRRQFFFDVRMLLRQEGDRGETRQLETASDTHIAGNLDKFVQKWRGTVKPATITQATKLKCHSKCLSGIPPGAGTHRNECLHSKLSRLIHGRSVVSLEVLTSILLPFLIIHNRNIEKKCTPIVSKCMKEMDKGISDIQDFTNLGIISSVIQKEEEVHQREDSDIDFDLISCNVKRLFSVCEAFGNGGYEPLEILLSSSMDQNLKPSWERQQLQQNLEDIGYNHTHEDIFSSEFGVVQHFFKNGHKTLPSLQSKCNQTCNDLSDEFGCVIVKVTPHLHCPYQCFVPKRLVESEPVVIAQRAPKEFQLASKTPARKVITAESVADTSQCSCRSADEACSSNRCPCCSSECGCTSCKCKTQNCMNPFGRRQPSTNSQECRCGKGASSRAVSCDWRKCPCFSSSQGCSDK